MADNLPRTLIAIQGIAAKLEATHTDTIAMIKIMIDDGLGAQRYGQHGGSNPDPTGNHTLTRNTQPEHDQTAYIAAIQNAYRALDTADIIRRRYTPASNDTRNRLDPTDYCRLHWQLRITEGHRRHKGDLCKVCLEHVAAAGHEPTLTDLDYWHRHGHFPHKPIDPRR